MPFAVHYPLSTSERDIVLEEPVVESKFRLSQMDNTDVLGLKKNQAQL